MMPEQLQSLKWVKMSLDQDDHPQSLSSYCSLTDVFPLFIADNIFHTPNKTPIFPDSLQTTYFILQIKLPNGEYSPLPEIIYPHAGEFSNVVHHKPNVTFLDESKHCLCVYRPPILGHNRRLYCHGNW